MLKGDKSLGEIASANNVLPRNLQKWKAKFLSNAELAMDPSQSVKEYKEANKDLQIQLDKYAKVVGKLTVERDWVVGKLKSLDSFRKTALIEPKHENISLLKQTELLNISRSRLYYKAVENKNKLNIKQQIQKIFMEIPIYGEKKVHQQLLEYGFPVSLNTVSKYRKELGLRAILAVKPVSTTVADIQHHKYPYKLKDIEICKANQVWSADITYIKINGGMVYLAAIIDWYSKLVLSYRISNVMDTELVMDVLNEALLKYGQPEIFNTDQGSQYTSYIHTQTLTDKGIEISMDGKGRATDNIAIERFWRSAKCERIYLNEYETVKSLKDDVKDYIEFYNTQRFHETLEYKKPIDVYLNSIKFCKSNYAKKGCCGLII